eukprot:jgi/Orpsp1_1/1177912/evm.model.c7180000063303.1
MTKLNSTISMENYDSFIELLLKKGSKKYDLLFFDVIHTKKYSPYFLDLNQFLPKDIISLYNNKIVDEVCKYNGHLYGLYGKDILKTWNELVISGKYIYYHEKEKGNTDLIGYNGFIPDNESCMCSIHELIYSFRKTKDSPFPGYRSQEAIDALNKLKEIKENISSDFIFQNEDLFNIMTIINGNSIFTKYWRIPYNHPDLKPSILPGKNDGVSGTTIGGFNIGVNRYISKNNQEATLKVLKFITSREFQKEMIVTQNYISGMMSLYDDDDVCNVMECDLIKELQPIARPISEVEDYDNYSHQFQNHIFQFMYGNQTANDVLGEIDDITKIYYMTLDSKDTKSGLYMFIL